MSWSGGRAASMAVHMSVGLWNPRYCGRNRVVATAGPAASAPAGGASSSIGAAGAWRAVWPVEPPGSEARAALRAGPGRPRRPLLGWAGGLRRLVSIIRRRLVPGPVGGRRRAVLLPGGVLPARAAAGSCSVSARGVSSVSRGLVRGGAAESSRTRGLAAGRRWLAVRGGRCAASCCRGPVGLRGRLTLAEGPGLPWAPVRGRGPVPLPPAGFPSSTARVPGRGAPWCPGSGSCGGGPTGLGGACGWCPPLTAPSWGGPRSNSSVNAAKSPVPKRQRSILAPVPISWVRCSPASVLQAWDRAARVMACIWRANGPAKMPPEIGSILKFGLADRAISLRTL